MSINSICNINDFSEEILLGIFSYASDDDLAKCTQVCKTWLRLVNDEKFLDSRCPEEAFGKKKWEAIIGAVGDVPPVPLKIRAILQEPCPFFPGQTVKDTHFLIYKPTHVNGRPLTIKHFRELIEKTIPFSRSTDNISDTILHQYGEMPVGKGEWILMTKWVLPESCGEPYPELATRLTKLNTQAKANYQLPTLIDAITCCSVKILEGHYNFSQFIMPQENEPINSDQWITKTWKLINDHIKRVQRSSYPEERPLMTEEEWSSLIRNIPQDQGRAKLFNALQHIFNDQMTPTEAETCGLDFNLISGIYFIYEELTISEIEEKIDHTSMLQHCFTQCPQTSSNNGHYFGTLCQENSSGKHTVVSSHPERFKLFTEDARSLNHRGIVAVRKP